MLQAHNSLLEIVRRMLDCTIVPLPIADTLQV